VRHARELVLALQLGPADRARLADARQVVPLEVDDHHVLGGVLGVVDVLAGGAGALDRPRHERAAAAGEEELGRRRDDPPPEPGEGARRERPERRQRGGQRRRVTREGRRQMLDEICLVDVAARDRTPDGLDRVGVAAVAPAALPRADGAARSRPVRGLTLVSDAAGKHGQLAGLGWRRQR
jgi:hypothetical protein